MDMRVDSSASQADDWLPRIHNVVSLADTSVAKLHGHDYWNDHAKVFDDVGNEAGWIEDREEANSDGWIDGDNSSTKHSDNVCPLPDPGLHKVDFTRALPATLMSDARSGIGVEQNASDCRGNPVTIKREPEDFDHQCAQSFDAFPHGDTFTEERDIAIKQETTDGDYYPDPYLCSSRANVFPEEMNNVITTGLDSVPDGMMQEQRQFMQQPILDPTIKLEPTCSQPIEQFGQTPGFDHPIKPEPDESMISHNTDNPNSPEQIGNPCDKQAQRSGTKIRVTTEHKCAGKIPVLKDKKQVLTSPVQGETDAEPSTFEPQRPSKIAKYSSIDDYVEWLADYISKGNKSNIVLKGPTKLINDVTKKVNEKIELAKKAQSLAKESSEMHVQHPKANFLIDSPVPSTSTAPPMKWTSNGIDDQRNNQGFHFNDINQRPLLSTEKSNTTPNNSHVTNALPNYSLLGLTNSLPHTVRSVPIVFIGDMNHLSAPTTSPRKYTCNISKTKRDVQWAPPRRSERERKVPLPLTPPDAKWIALRRSGRERKVPRPYSPPPIKTKRSYTPARAPAMVTKTAPSPCSDASVASGTRMSDMIRLQGGISLMPAQYRIISGACTERIQPSDDVGTLGSIRNTIIPLDDVDNPKTEMIVEPTVNVPRDDLNDGDIKPPSLLTVGELSHLNDWNVGGNPETDTMFEPTRTTFHNDHDYEDIKPPLPLEDVGSRPSTYTRELLPSPHHNRGNALLHVNEVGNPQTKMSVEPNRTVVPDDYDHGGGKPPLTLTGSARSGITVREMLQSSHLSSANTMSPLHSHYDNDDDDIKPPNMTVRELLRHKKRCELQERLQVQEKALEDLRRKRMEQIERRKTDPDLSDLY